MNTDFVDFAKIDLKRISRIRKQLRRGLQLVVQLSNLHPNNELIRYCRTSIRDQLARLDAYEQLDFDDRPVYFLDGEQRVFEATVKLVEASLIQAKLIVDEAKGLGIPVCGGSLQWHK